ncbi:hypothetical protein ED733_005040 [Metarhizium rileyi]|uniref:diacylglycerol O-acyltransferase n=1 Tax=Metarhizium rileyi (strain RCEF 4871) TaxID=1649241 RepID=A0A5C6GCH4_METRR|nr:hypothetical protein ED733_005040 [Metarhizium rileyi]
MASNVGVLATEALPPIEHNTVSAATTPSDDILRLAKRQRESESVSPRSRAAQLPNSLGSSSKVARLSLASTARTPVPLTGAAALEDDRRRRVDEQAQSPSPISPNPTRSALEFLLSGVAQPMSRPSDTLQLAPTANMEPATKAATALSMAAGSADRLGDHDRDEGSPPGNANTNTTPPVPVTENPAPMELDSKKNDQGQSQPLLSSDERSQPGSLSYPGSLQATANLSEPPSRGISFPMPGQMQNSPTSSGGKKHKCPYCSTEFTRHHNLKSHLLTHSQEKPYVCTDCQMRFRRLHDLKRHGKLHTGEKPHICPKCDRKFARGDALARHSKGAGGCAGRRASMGSFADGDELDGTMGEGDESTMSGVTYDNAEDEELRRQSLPSMGLQHSSGDNYSTHSRTYPPAGPRPTASGLYPPNVNQGQIGTVSSSSVPDSMASSHTANTSVSSIPGGPGGAGMYSQAGMTESPKPLSPGLPGHDSANSARQRSPTMTQQYQQQHMGRAPSDMQSPHSSGQARPKLPGLSHPGFVAPNPGTFSQGRTSGGAQAAGDSGNMFAQSDPSVWEYIRLLEDKIKCLSDKVLSLDQDVADLKKQLETREVGSETSEKVTVAQNPGDKSGSPTRDVADSGTTGQADLQNDSRKLVEQLEASNPSGHSYAAALKYGTLEEDEKMTNGDYKPYPFIISEMNRKAHEREAWKARGIRFAPLRVPFKRRMQTAAVLFHSMSIVVLVSCFWFSCANPLTWPILVPYLVHLSFSNAATDGNLAYRSEWLRSLPLWKLFAGYFPAKLHKTFDLPPNRKYIFGYHPHGIISHGAWCAFATNALAFSDKFPGITNSLLTLDSNFRLPFYRDWILAMGIRSVSKESIRNILSKGGAGNDGQGRAVTIVIGGARESLQAQPGTFHLILKGRKGFVKMALRSGADLVPVIGFGENDLYDQLSPKTHPLVHKAQMILLKVFKFTIPALHGRGLLNYDVGLMPYRRAVNIVVGRPIEINEPLDEQPSQDVIDKYHELYVEEVERLYNAYKDVFSNLNPVPELRILS